MEPQNTPGQLTAQARTRTGKEIAGKMRKSGQIPAVVYGGQRGPVPLAINPLALENALDPQKLRNTLLELTVEADGQPPMRELVMLKEFQRDMTSHALTHADFVRVTVDKPVRVSIPLELDGRPEGVKIGGTLHKVFRTLPVECTPDRIPARFSIDVSAMNIGDSCTIGQLETPTGVKVLMPASQTIALVFAPRAAAEETTSEEGAEGDAPAAGETPAAEPKS